nr:hypothetical protein [Bacteroidales bacterium]
MISISINNFVLILVLFVVAVGITFWLFKRKIDILKKLAYSDELGIFNHRELNKQLNIVIKNKIKKPFAFI